MIEGKEPHSFEEQKAKRRRSVAGEREEPRSLFKVSCQKKL
ncbi:MAG: hypothetical protein QXJ19_06680 [Candidatus Bathyarchaeia archaeon]